MSEENENTTDEAVAQTAENNILGEALAKLNHDDDAHWTEDGLPDCNVLTEYTGVRIEREDVQALAPDFVRQPAADKMDLGAALSLLDHANEEHWEKTGGVFGVGSREVPSLTVLSELVGREIVREDVDNLAPDFARETEVATGSDEASLASLEGETVTIVDGDEAELATMPEGDGPIEMMEAAINAASPDFIRFHPSFAQVVQQFQAMLPSIREEAARNKVRGRRFGA